MQIGCGVYTANRATHDSSFRFCISFLYQCQGTIIARGGNDIGIQGIISNPQNVCISVARVFDDLGNGAPNSEIDLSLEWCADQGSRVINLSLGSDRYNSNSAALYEKLATAGIFLVAAAGNGYDSIDFYPASYIGVTSVGSVNADLQHSAFSIYNKDVDLVAPGENILSTAPRMGLYDYNGYEYLSALMTVSPRPNEVVKADFVDCGDARDYCQNAQGKICLIKRTELDFDQMALACEGGGGVGAVVYTPTNMVFRGALLSSYLGSIPIMEVDWHDGSRLLLQTGGMMTLKVPSYAVLGGTSMAAPHVAGIAAKIWAARPLCTMMQVREALFNTAKDLGDLGRDDYYGYGLVQAFDAYNYLLDLPSPCGLTASTGTDISGQSFISAFSLGENQIEFGQKVPIGINRDELKVGDLYRDRGTLNRNLDEGANVTLSPGLLRRKRTTTVKVGP
jgi:serine protease